MDTSELLVAAERPTKGQATAATRPERVGVVVVHGIGEQRRFEHLDGHIRGIIRAVRAQHPQRTTIEVLRANAAAFQAEQDTWLAGRLAPVRLRVKPEDGGREVHIAFHEVWWADVNEPYSLLKQAKFWAWGLSIWALAGKERSDQWERGTDGTPVMEPPAFPRSERLRRATALGVRVRLFLVSWFFLMSAFTLGLVIFLARRLFGLGMPDFLRTFVTYVSAVKLYSQRRSSGGGPLEDLDEAPRVAIRRRMVRTIADVALAEYDRWYILAHSLGSVVAFNGLMEPAYALPHYLDHARWRRLLMAKLAGPADRPEETVVPDGRPMMPPRPIWVSDGEVVYRRKLFSRFAGLLTYGSPLDKFAAIWPARVPLNKDAQVFPSDAVWINVFDPTDPVSAPLKAYGTPRMPGELHPTNIGVPTSWLFLSGHLAYLKRKRNPNALELQADRAAAGDTLADRVARWLVEERSPAEKPWGEGWYEPKSFARGFRSMVAALWWVGLAGLFMVLALEMDRRAFGNFFGRTASLAAERVLGLSACESALCTGGRFALLVALIVLLVGGAMRLVVGSDQDQSGGGPSRTGS
jgi:hypothetical protein